MNRDYYRDGVDRPNRAPIFFVVYMIRISVRKRQRIPTGTKQHQKLVRICKI